MVAPIRWFSSPPAALDGTVQKCPAARQPEEAGRVVLVGYVAGRADEGNATDGIFQQSRLAPFVVAGAAIGLTLFAVAAAVALGKGKPPLERQLIKLVDRLFPVGPKREWLLRGFDRHAYLPHLPFIPPESWGLMASENPMRQRGIDLLGAEWYQALHHRYGNSILLVVAARKPGYYNELIPDIRKDQGNLRSLIALYRRLERDGIVFSERQAIDLEEATEVLDSIKPL